MPEYLPDRFNPLLLSDEGYVETEELLYYMAAEIESVYGQAYLELLEQARKHLEWFIAADEAKRKLFDAGKLSKDDYQTWRRNQLLTGRHNHSMIQNMADVLTNKNVVAASVINGYLPEAYAINGNYITYEIEKNFGINTMFELIDEQTVERLLREKPDLLPQASVNIPKDLRWNKEKLNSAIVQGILQGDGVEKIAERLAEVSDMNKKAALRNAATMTTSAQNGGRLDGLKRAQDIGVTGLKVQWIATLDGHTRASHRHVDGEIREIGKKFSNGLKFPGDPEGKPEEIYNCRCVIAGAFEDAQINGTDGRNNRINRMGQMSYEEWKNAKGGEPLFKAARNVNRDMKMHEEYMSLLGSKVPKSFDDFQRLKYSNPDKWKSMISDARKARNKKRKS